jgi:hypothetical protein
MGVARNELMTPSVKRVGLRSPLFARRTIFLATDVAMGVPIPQSPNGSSRSCWRRSIDRTGHGGSLQDIGAKRPTTSRRGDARFEAALLAPRWPDFAAGLEVLAHDITTERMVELPNDNES